MAQGRKLVWAALLAVGLWQFVLLGFFSAPSGQSITFWGSYVLPWLRRLGMTAPIVIVGVVTGCLLRPRRPEPLAAFIAAAAALPIALLFAFPERLWSTLFMFLFGGGARGVRSLGLEPHYWSHALPPAVSHLFLMFWALGLPAAAAGWVGANHWRAGNWERFWKGPGGAIVRGGLVTGVIGVALELVRWYVVIRLIASAPPAPHGLVPHVPTIWHVVILSLGAVSFGAVTALLVGWRPRPMWGAFAGSGLALALLSFSLLNMIIERSFGHMGSVRVIDAGIISVAVVRMVEGAVAGVFAGKWEDGAET